MSTSFKMV